VADVSDPFDGDVSRPRRKVPVREIRNAVICIALATLIDSFLHSRGVDVPYVLMVTVFLAGDAMIELMRRLSPPPIPETLRDTQEPKPPSGVPDADGVFRAVRSWTSRLEWTEDDTARFAHIVQPQIVAIVDERLRLRHAIERHVDPDQARALCGPELWRFVTEPVTRSIGPNDVATVVAQMEAL
jgi:hypothetical protein